MTTDLSWGTPRLTAALRVPHSTARRRGRAARRAARFAMLILASLSFSAAAHTQYRGQLGTQPITLAGDLSGTRAAGIYVYDRYDTPIELHGERVDGVLELREKDSQGRESATLRFADFDPTDSELSGVWTSQDGSQRLPIRLKRQFEIVDGKGVSAPDYRLLQAASTNDHYFRSIAAKQIDDYYSRVVGIEVIEKGTDRLLQTIELDVEYRSTANVLTGDFNFDNVPDIEVFEASYFGPNTTSLYFLRTPGEARYERAEFSGVSLSFDSSAKRVYEHNQCCAGTRHESATYKVIGNRLELIERVCHRMDENEEDFVEVPCSE